MNLDLRKYCLLVLALLLQSLTLLAQTDLQPVPAPAANDYEGTLSFLSSDWMEGREADARGGFMAADYIATMMQLNGLTPFGDPNYSSTGNFNKRGGGAALQPNYFQDFEVVRYKTEKAAFAFVRRTATSESLLQLSYGIDFELLPIPYSTEVEAPLVFAGYGISAPDKGYDDYKGLDVKDRVVAVITGSPGNADTASPAWKKLGKALGEEYTSLDKKLQTAEKLGAVALIVVSPDGSFKPYRNVQTNFKVVNSAMNSPKNTEPGYDDPEYALPGDTAISKVPCFILLPNATKQLFAGTGIVLADVEKKIARDLSPASMQLNGKLVKISVEVKTESMIVRNVLGILTGKDSTKNIVVGAHYDHLGIRTGQIFNGADDNASGTSGMLALAKKWVGHSEKPACNIIFAAWTAEEKGLLGSSFFVEHPKTLPDRILLYINLDMISRSAPEDTANNILSIGTMTGSDRLKKIAGASNQKRPHPFVLDLWDVTGHTGSDYASFTAVKIPVMTFFSGFHVDYHTPRDVASKVDFDKMGDILKVVNDCIQEFAGNPLKE